MAKAKTPTTTTPTRAELAAQVAELTAKIEALNEATDDADRPRRRRAAGAAPVKRKRAPTLAARITRIRRALSARAQLFERSEPRYASNDFDADPAELDARDDAEAAAEDRERRYGSGRIWRSPTGRDAM